MMTWKDLPLQRPIIWTIRSSQGMSLRGISQRCESPSQICLEKVQLKNKWSWVSRQLWQRRHFMLEKSMWRRSWVPNRPWRANQRINPHFGIAVENQTILCHLTVECFSLIAFHVDLVEKSPLAEGSHKTISLLEGSGCQFWGIACLRVRRSGELATGHDHWPSWMIDATVACLGSPES